MGKHTGREQGRYHCLQHFFQIHVPSDGSSSCFWPHWNFLSSNTTLLPLCCNSSKHLQSWWKISSWNFSSFGPILSTNICSDPFCLPNIVLSTKRKAVSNMDTLRELTYFQEVQFSHTRNLEQCPQNFDWITQRTFLFLKDGKVTWHPQI